MVIQQMNTMEHLHQVLKIDLVLFGQPVHVRHQRARHHPNSVNPVNHYGIVRIPNNKQRKVHFKMVQKRIFSTVLSTEILLHLEPTTNIREHDSFVTNKTYCIYLSNLEVPNIVFAATLDDYVDATLLITQMNKHEQLTKVQANTYKSK